MYFPGIFFIFFLCPLVAGAQLPGTTGYGPKGEKGATGSNYIYILPYPQGKSHFLVQGYNSGLSHKNELSLDFMMKKGSGICAARAGVVEATRKDSHVGGLKNAYLYEGNYIIIRHSDSSTAWYWHLQKDGVLINKGDTVATGQLIGYSGNTGYTAFPHLHFQVIDKDGKNMPTMFYTRKGVKLLRPLNWYRRG
jgi:murein DD-endopeptidase MepM/ murein hydrolase activator NlpD